MDFYFILFGVLGFGGIILGFIGYKVVTGNIIKDLERENEILRTDNERMRAALAAKRPAQDKKYLVIATRGLSKDKYYKNKLEEAIKASVSGIIYPDNYTFEEF